MIVSVEGLKGSGKSTLVQKLHEEHGFPVARKYTKDASPPSPFPLFIEEFKEKYGNSFKNITSSLGLRYYANFFGELERQESASGASRNSIFDRGIVSLGYSGYYGYVNNKETLPLPEYEALLFELHREALGQYSLHVKRTGQHTLFVMVDCVKDVVEQRIRARLYAIPSDTFLLEHYNQYVRLAEGLEDQARLLLRSPFVHVRSDMHGDGGVTLLSRPYTLL